MSQPTMIEKMVCGGAAACVADVFTFPFDVAKVRLQCLGEVVVPVASETLAINTIGGAAIAIESGPQFKGLTGTMLFLARNEGMSSLWGGIGPGLQRQCIFASIRLGIYDSIRDSYKNFFQLDDQKYSQLLMSRMLAGITSGAVAISVAQPTDVVKVKMQANGNGFKSSIDAYRTIYQQNGARGLWNGLGPNVVRNSVVNATELVCYDTIKDLLKLHLKMDDNLGCHFTAAFGAGFCATIVASPIDVIKTRIMNSTAGQYKNMLDCGKKLFDESGPRAFYKGFTPSFIRLGSWNVVMFVTFEQLKKFAGERRETNDCLKGKSKVEHQSTSRWT